MTSPSKSSIQAKLGKQSFQSALEEAELLLNSIEEDPDTDHDPEALYLAAVCARYCQRFSQAQAYLEQLQGDSYRRNGFADQARLLQEQGHLYRDQNQTDKALECYRSACALNPYLTSAWQAQLRLAQHLSQQHPDQRPPNSQQPNQRQPNQRQPNQQQLGQQLVPFVQAQLQRLNDTPKVLIAVGDLISQGKLLKAESLCRKFLLANPTHPEAMRLLAELASRFGSYEDAELLLTSAIELAPNNEQLKIELINVMRRRQKFSEALDIATALYQKQPNNPQFQSLLAIEKMQMGNYSAAVELFDATLAQIPNDPITLTSKGHALKTWGKQEESVECYQNAAALGHGEAFYALANLKTYQFSTANLEQMNQLLQQKHLSNSNRIHMEFALGKAYEDLEDYPQSFSHYRNGNAAKKFQSSYRAEIMTEELQAQQRYFTREVFASRRNQGCTAADPIFILGLPRAGSTLLEQILASHSQVDGTLELPNILSYTAELRKEAKQLNLENYLEVLSQKSPEQLQQLGQRYLDETRIHRQGAPFFIDKMPNNFRYIGLIKLILPNAKIIDARRHPLSCCFSGFKQLFAEGQEFSYDLNDIASYYKDYVTLMHHWDKVIPGEVLRVDYETVVQDLEGQVRRLLDYCNLPFEAQCLEFHKTQRAVRTASSEQVRQPIYQHGLEQWQYYREQLTDLMLLLEPEIKAHEERINAL